MERAYDEAKDTVLEERSRKVFYRIFPLKGSTYLCKLTDPMWIIIAQYKKFL
jgi:hypothetical protein